MACKGLGPAATKKVVAELVELTTRKPCEGITVQFSEQNVCEVLADIDGPVGTPYEHGVFRIRLSLSPDYPHSPPKGHFLTKTFHPNVSEAGEICVNVLKKDWKPDLGIRHVLMVGACSPRPIGAAVAVCLAMCGAQADLSQALAGRTHRGRPSD